MLSSARPCFWFSRSTLKSWKWNSEYVPCCGCIRSSKGRRKGAMSRQTSTTGHNPNENENDGTNIYFVHRNVTSQYAVIHLKPMRAVYWTSETSCSTRKVKTKICLPQHRRLWIVIIFSIITIIIIIIIIIQVLFILGLFNDSFNISDKSALNDRQR
jgi:hypothetical protein